jgi:hypothetical protein
MKVKKIRAGALQLTVFITVVVALLLGAFILYIQLQNNLKAQQNLVAQTIQNTTNGIAYSLQNSQTKTDSVVLQDNAITTSLKTSQWGLFTKIIAQSNVKNFRFKKVALLGAKKSSIALQLSENYKPLVLVGNTTIQGNALLPKQGVKGGNIAGVSYYNTFLINGATQNTRPLPEFSGEFNTYINSVFLQPKSNSTFINIEKQRIWENSFYNATNYLYSNNPVSLNNVKLTGNIVVQSATKIIVDPSAILTDVVLIAPEIEVLQNTTGSFQVLATKNITIHQNVQLNYPSALFINAINTNNDQASMLVKQGAQVNGVLAYINKGEYKNTHTHVFLDKQTTIVGEVFCNSNTELLGKVYGSVYTNNFIAKQSGSIYLNHIYNGEISIDKLPNPYAGLIFDSTLKKAVSKWLY